MLPSKEKQRQIWRRVQAQPFSPQPRGVLQACRKRALMNLRFYESRKSDPLYGPAYARLAELSRQEAAMLQQIG